MNTILYEVCNASGFGVFSDPDKMNTAIWALTNKSRINIQGFDNSIKVLDKHFTSDDDIKGAVEASLKKLVANQIFTNLYISDTTDTGIQLKLKLVNDSAKGVFIKHAEPSDYDGVMLEANKLYTLENIHSGCNDEDSLILQFSEFIME